MILSKTSCVLGHRISAKIGESRLKSAKNRPKFDSDSTRNQLNLSSNRLNGGSSFHTQGGGGKEHLNVTFMCVVCKPNNLGESPKTGNSQKRSGEGGKRCSGPREQRSPKRLLHRPNPILHQCNPIFSPVQPHSLAPVQEAFRSLSPKDLLHPLPNHHQQCPVFDPSPRFFGVQCVATLMAKQKFRSPWDSVGRLQGSKRVSLENARASLKRGSRRLSPPGTLFQIFWGVL